jgi:hypothetical protein
MKKIANVSGFCPYLDEDVTIKATFTEYSVLGAESFATPLENLCENRDSCDIEPQRGCPVFNQSFLWNEI